MILNVLINVTNNEKWRVRVLDWSKVQITEGPQNYQFTADIIKPDFSLDDQCID